MNHDLDVSIAQIRNFNRYYTQLIGALNADFLGSELTMPEARLLYEIVSSEPVSATVLQDRLGMDAGYLSRIIARFEKRGWIVRGRGEDARARPISLTQDGAELFARVDVRQRDALAQLVSELDRGEREDLVRSMARVRLYLSPDLAPGDVRIRNFRSGDLGWMIQRQAQFYDAHYGWGLQLEATAAEIVTNFVRQYDPARSHCWIAELDGVMAGSLMLSDEGEDLARLRLVFVEPFARKRGIADQLLAEATSFAQNAGHRGIRLWTHTVLDAARRLYARHEFVQVNTATHYEFGEPVEGETWELRFSDCGSKGQSK
ncbi:GNAT family N-acetyltransferase [Altererythrobacter indicus]|uniref:GNAT family N-acetyltransferase n=1 Tax=Altericroceibacterium indicum TaxID=374177 RepID=A0A845A5M9_9SPHN|nr:helix-turn-helix domain-containing GNAT family N-acetyltransferase [Altericroceibacterium indicum]MXP24867.1 GNAT family N-acetyltransferase [Altericroceibacterium indicum]